MMALKTVIKHRFENRKAKHIAYIAFLVLTTMLVVYSVLLLFQDISTIGKSDEHLVPSYMSTSSSVFSPQTQLMLKSFTQIPTNPQTLIVIWKSPGSQTIILEVFVM